MSLLKYFKKTRVPSSGRETASAGDESAGDGVLVMRELGVLVMRELGVLVMRELGVLVMRELGVLVMRELGVLLQAYRNLVKPVQVT